VSECQLIEPRSGLLTAYINSKIENFIRTKYESKRWVMDGPMPDPSTLEGDDDDVVSVPEIQSGGFGIAWNHLG
jgi:hypothetical protein